MLTALRYFPRIYSLISRHQFCLFGRRSHKGDKDGREPHDGFGCVTLYCIDIRLHPLRSAAGKFFLAVAGASRLIRGKLMVYIVGIGMWGTGLPAYSCSTLHFLLIMFAS